MNAAESKHAAAIGAAKDWWKTDGRRVVFDDQQIADAARRAAGERCEPIPSDAQIAKIRAVREAFASAPNHPGFVTEPTALADVSAVEAAMLADGHLCDVADFDGYESEHLLFEREKETVSASDSDAAQISQRESSYIFVCKNRAGEIVPAEMREKGERAKAELEECGMNLALALASQGIPGFLPKKSPRASIVCPELEKRIDITAFRRINFLPPVAKARRDPIVKNLEAFAEREGNCRMAVFTMGRRIAITGKGEAVRALTQAMHRRISKLNAHPLFTTNRAQLQFRATEYGSLTIACAWPRVPGTYSVSCPWPRVPGTEQGIASEDAGAPYVHLHAHVVYTLEHQLPPARWRAFLRRVGNLWRHHWGDNGQIQDVREACKYPIKPGDYGHLENAHIARFYHATRGIHLVQPLGKFRTEVADRREASLKLVRLRGSDSKLKLRVKPDWNARFDRLTTPEKNARASYKSQERKRGLSLFIRAAKLLAVRDSLLIATARLLTQRGTRAENAARVFNPLSDAFLAGIVQTCAALTRAAVFLFCGAPRPFAERRLSGIPKLKAADRVEGARRMQDRIGSRLAPAPYFDRITRPALLVWNFSGDYAALRSHGFVRDYLAAVRPQIRRAESELSRLNVHTSHTTVWEKGGGVGLLETREAWPEPPPVPIFAEVSAN